MRHVIDRNRSYDRAVLHNGDVVQGNSKANLGFLIGQRLQQLDYLANVPNFTAYVEDAICRGLSDDRACRECKYVDEESPDEIRAERVLRLDDVGRFLTTAARWIANGAEFVPVEESERRAAICAQCPLNVEVAGCVGCSGLAARAAEMIPDRPPGRYDDQLKQCGVCACFLTLKTKLPLGPPDGLNYPSWCWASQPEAP